MTQQHLAEMFAMQDCAEITRLDPFDTQWDEAIDNTKRFRDNHGGTQMIAGNHIKGYFLSKENISRLLTQDGQSMSGIRIYIGIDPGGIYRVVVVATKENDVDDYKVPTSYPAADLPLLGEARPCPEWCPKSNVLNSPNEFAG